MLEEPGLSDREVDLCVIGAGPGGYVAAIKAAQLGLKTAVVERDVVGGVCLNRGCIPTKAMLRSANLLETFNNSAQFGVLADNVRYDYAQVLAFRDKVVRGLTGGVSALLQSQGVEVVAGSAQLLGPGRVQVSGEAGGQIQARAVMLATGSAPARLPIPGGDRSGVIDSDGALALREVPERMLIIGAGAVGCEWANVFHAFGTKVTLVELLPSVLPVEDEEIGRLLGRSFSRRGIDVRTGARVERIDEGENGALLCTVTGGDGQQEQIAADRVLVAVGRRPVTDGLGLEEAGVKTERGWVVIDDHLRTNLPNVSAIGDVITMGGPHYQLAHVSSMEGVLLAERIAGQQVVPINYDHVPRCTYCDPEIGSVGLTETQAKAKGYDVRTGSFPFKALGRARMAGETEGFVKIVADKKYDEVLGVHIIGPRATELVAEAVLALRLECTVEELVKTIHAHPTMSEAVGEAAHAAHGAAIHI